MTVDSYLASGVYQSLICLARHCNREEYFADNRYMQNVIEMERGTSGVAHISYSKDFSFVKKNIIEALEFGRNRLEVLSDDKILIDEIIEQAEKAQSSHLLLVVCKDGIELFRKYKTEI